MPMKEKKTEPPTLLPSLPRPHLTYRNSNSVPSTPLQQNRRLSFGARSPSPNKHLRDGSPKSVYSQAEPGAARTRAKAPSFTGCRFETGMAFSRRRIPYSEGGDMLERAKTMPKKFLNNKDEGKLTGDMRALYDRILPSKESDCRRTEFVRKLDRILNQRWPGNDIRIHMFGSSGNMLCTNDSDVDICITTPLKALEKTCLLAEALAEHGMKRVVCVPHAKVPIVKFWDPEIQLACDMNVNNTLALENTRMIKTYVQIDDRVRPMAMIVKHWTKQRILNDAALGGTLSSYAWICMILNFLQTRNPPIIPSLHEKANKSSPLVDGKYPAFNDDLEKLKGFGKENKETLGDLLFQFFRRYAHDLDYDKNVISVREGRLISKEAKKWHLMQNNRLCIEEPFNVERNLGNTADDISFRGIHIELRRAFDLISEAKLEQCLEQYVFPPTEERVWEKPAPKPPPVLRSRSQSQSSRGKGGQSSRGGRHSGSHSKSRRASSAAATNKYPLAPANLPIPDRPLIQPEQYYQTQMEQMKLHEQLFNEMQTLQRQEHELRMKHAQNQIKAEFEIQANAQTLPGGPQSAREQSRRYQMATQVPMSAPLRGTQQFSPYSYPQVPGTPPQNVHTQPSSPSLRSAQPDLRRSIHRSMAADGSSSSNVRSHSQPARAMPTNAALQSIPPVPMNSQQLQQYQSMQRYQMQHDPYHNGMMEQQGNYRHGAPTPFLDSRRHLMQTPFEESIPKEYAGYVINDALPPHPYRDDPRFARIPYHHDLYPRVRGVPLPHNIRGESRSPSPTRLLPVRERAFSLQSTNGGRQRLERVAGTTPAARSQGPIIVNGTDALNMPEAPPMLESSSRTTTVSETTSGSDEHPLETPNTADLEQYRSGPFEENFAFEQAQQLYKRHQQMNAERQRHPAPYDTRMYMEPSSRRLSTQQAVEPLTDSSTRPVDRRPTNGRGLNIQFGEQDFTRPLHIPEKPYLKEPKRPADQTARPDLPVPSSTADQVDKNLTVGPLLSPVREVRTPSPNRRGKEDAMNLAKASSIKRANAKLDLRIPSWAECVKSRKAKDAVPSSPERSRPNGSLTPKSNGFSPHKAGPTPSPQPVPQPPHNTPVPVLQKPTTTHQQINGWQQQTSKKHKKNKSRTEPGQFVEAQAVADRERKGG